MSQNTVEIPSSGKEVRELLEKLKLPIPDRDGMAALSSEGAEFAQKLAEAARSPNMAVLQLEYLKDVTTAVAPETREAIAAAGLEVPLLTAMIEIAKEEGESFRKAIRLLQKNAADTDRQAAVTYLGQLFEQIGVGEHIGLIPTPTARQTDAAPQKREDNPLPESPDQQKTPRIESSPNDKVRQIPNNNSPESDRRYGQSIHVYGSKNAVCFNAGMQRDKTAQTINVESAQALGDRRYDWENKIAIQLTQSELPLVLALFMGEIKEIRITSHGASNEKSMTIENQGNQFFLVMMSKGQAARATPIPAMEAYPITAMFIDQLIKNNPALGASQVMALVRHFAKMYVTPRSQAPREVSNG
ncbi:hypothetical protein [Azonexus hydrophilus]|uniref:Uncharacterized protein n=1 Tax=Azonexus hydrophilus TaxID=418702 RepID=A0ABZ2XQ35_9RHOO